MIRRGFRIVIVVFLGGIVLFPPVGLTGSQNINTYHYRPQIDSSRFKDGDVILRGGTGVISEIFASCSLRDRTFSHAGILISSEKGWMVCHSIGGEAFGPGFVRLESLRSFCSAEVTDTVKVFRLSTSAHFSESMKAYCLFKCREKTPFDRNFDLSDTASMYCTEFVYMAYLNATSGVVSLPLTRFNGKEYVACDNIYINEYAEPL